jgi:hypothetical protein
MELCVRWQQLVSRKMSTPDIANAYIEAALTNGLLREGITMTIDSMNCHQSSYHAALRVCSMLLDHYVLDAHQHGACRELMEQLQHDQFASSSATSTSTSTSTTATISDDDKKVPASTPTAINSSSSAASKTFWIWSRVKDDLVTWRDRRDATSNDSRHLALSARAHTLTMDFLSQLYDHVVSSPAPPVAASRRSLKALNRAHFLTQSVPTLHRATVAT